MQVTTLSKSQFEKLKKFEPGDNIINTEAELFIMGSEHSKKKSKMLLKRFYVNEGEYFGKKMMNINTLLYYKRILQDVDGLVLPNTLAVTGGSIIGYTMPFIEDNINLKTYLDSSDYSLDEKIGYLKKVGTVLEEIDNLQGFPHSFHLGDMHEANFVIDKEGSLKVIDLDSAYISNNKPFASKYLHLNPLLRDLPYKYIEDEEHDIIPSKDTDIYCYVIMLLNTLARTQMCTITLEHFYTYMNYLEDLGVPHELLDCIEKIYHDGNNESPLHYLDSIPVSNCYRAHHMVFKNKTGIDLTNDYKILKHTR